MSKSRVQEGWRVSQVERLIDLPKRDIQRACYDGKGGASILQPADSTWGKRLYDIDDIAILMLVKLHKGEGYCLPEIHDLLNGPDGQVSAEKQLAIWKAKLEEELLETKLKLNRVLALLAALHESKDRRSEAVKNFLRQCLPEEAIEALTILLSKHDASHHAPESLDTLKRLLDEPGIDLAIDLWAGPGAYDRIVDILWNEGR